MSTLFHPLRILSIGLFMVLLSVGSFSASTIHQPANTNATIHGSTSTLSYAQPTTFEQITQGDAAVDVGPNAIGKSSRAKTDYNKDYEPQNKIIGSLDWQRWLDLPNHIKAKVDPRLISEFIGEIRPAHLGGTAESHRIAPADQQALDHTRFIVYLDEQLNLERELAQRVFASSAQQRAATLTILSAHAKSSQAGLSNTLNERMQSDEVLGYQSFFLVNAIAVEGNLDTIVALATRPDVARIQANYPLVKLWNSSQADQSGIESGIESDRLHQTAEQEQAQPQVIDTLSPGNWNIDLVEADRVWNELGTSGQGAVVAGFDTGVEYTHPAIKDNYRGKIGPSTYDHNYSWFAPDPNLYPDGNLGASLSDVPADCDYYGTHGTHTMGTMVGNSRASDSTGATDIGMAPDAKWIALPGICFDTMPGALGDDIGGLKAFQWLLCPTDLSGDLSTADCSKAPDVVNNSWGSANPVNDIFHPAIEALRAAGIAPVFASGNPRAGDGSIGTPGNSPAAITVGATDIGDTTAPFSGRGPSFYENEQKPELTAPGVDVRSSVGSSSYYEYSGTSMAAPHVAGLVALMVSADLEDGVRDFSVDDIERFMTYTAVDLGKPGFDELYGFGRIDAYAAVSWVKSAGDLRGAITNATTGAPIASAVVEGTTNAQSFTIETGTTGTYSITAPSGTYNIEVDAFGYESKIFSGQSVFPNSLSFADFQLVPKPRVLIEGVVTTGAEWSIKGGVESPASGSPVANAQLVLEADPNFVVTTDANGAYSMTLPSGNHQVIITSDSHRTITTTLNISASVSSASMVQNLTMDAAPRLLIVDADASGGWFTGWPVYPVFTHSLEEAGYPYDLWRIQYLNVTDVETNVDGSDKRGIPSLATLQQYDVVVWVHSGCGDFYCYIGGAPQNMDAEELLIAYLDGGGHLILSGQNISAWTNSDSELLEYLGSEHVDSFGGSEGEVLHGSNFLEDLSIKVTNSTLYGYSNGILYLSPDAVRASHDNAIAQPILQYNSGNSAALAVSPCTSDYRAIFYAAGYENLGPRADNRAIEAIDAMDRGIQWLAQSKQEYDLSFTANKLKQSKAQGKTVRFQLDVANSGLQPLTAQFNLMGAQWETLIFSGTHTSGVSPNTGEESELDPLGPDEKILILPCQAQVFTVEVEIPSSAKNGDRDVVNIEVTTDAPTAADSRSSTDQTEQSQADNEEQTAAPLLTKELSLTSVAFAAWESQTSMPTSRYRLAVESLPGDIHVYAMGGWAEFGYFTSAQNERYNVCSGEWEQLAIMPYDRTSIASAAVDGKIYVSGGFSAGLYSSEVQAENDLFVYDPATDQWSFGPDLPKPMYGHAMAAHEGKIYIFGGRDAQEDFDTVYSLDLTSGTWENLPNIPGGKRSYAGAAVLDDKIYLVGGWPAIEVVEVYDPASGQWSQAADLNIGRQTPGVEAAPDGYLYVTGGGNGWNGIIDVERYNSAEDDWEVISPLSTASRVGSGVAYAAGKLNAIGGVFNSRDNEGLQIASAFCLSDKQSITPVVQPQGVITYRVDIASDATLISNAAIVDTLPVSTTFVGFDANPIGAAYDPNNHTIEWSGSVPVGAQGLGYTYTVSLGDTVWPAGAEIISSIRFEGDLVGLPVFTSGAPVTTTTQSFTRETRSRIFIADFTPSSLFGSAMSVVQGEFYTYTVDLRSSNAAGGPVTVWSDLPTGMMLVEESLDWPVEVTTADTSPQSFQISGIVGNDDAAFVNDTDNYVWYDSLGETSFDEANIFADYEWVDISQSGTTVGGGDDRYICNQAIGFPFDFYEQTQTEFCVSTNGFLSFDPFGISIYTNECPLPSIYSNASMIAGLWDDLVTDAIYVQTIGIAPNRSLVVQFVDARRYGSLTDDFATFQIILYESGQIKVQFLDLLDGMGVSSTTGVSNYSNSLGVTYACNTFETLSQESAVLFTPPGSGIGNANSQLSFQVQFADALPINSTISNTVQISDTRNIYTRTFETILNPVGLVGTSELVNGTQVNQGEELDYQFEIENTGQLTADNATFTFPFSEHTTYVADSLTCSSGTCAATDTQVEWRGEIAGRDRVRIGFSVTVAAEVQDRTPILGTATIDDGFGETSTMQVRVLARSSDLSESQVTQQTQFIEQGQMALLNLVVRNTGNVGTESRATIELPPDLPVVEDSLFCGTGQCDYADGTVTWQGSTPPRSVIPIRLFVQPLADAPYGQQYKYTVTLTDLNRQELTELTGMIVVARQLYAPLLPGIQSPKPVYIPYLP